MRTTWVRPNIAVVTFAGLALLGTGLQLAQPAVTAAPTQVHAVQLAALQKPEPREPGAPTGPPTLRGAPGGPVPIPGPTPVPGTPPGFPFQSVQPAPQTVQLTVLPPAQVQVNVFGPPSAHPVPLPVPR
jgi:hypothetical protein